ncbi:uncharacterized protein [Porites lutea]|uniref:uncharacterized protein n=1 Tax=Porites lutea TaxID=51062 RepID=UPI003CC59255
MVLRQCVSCNSTILGTLPFCECGRVFEDIRQVGGKRFSKYRADLYTKLEAKRLKCNERAKKVLGGDSDSADEHQKQIVFQPKRIPPSVSLRTKTRRSRRKRRTHIKSLQEDRHERSLSLFQSPEEEAARLSRALQEINRRIMGQSMVWLNSL